MVGVAAAGFPARFPRATEPADLPTGFGADSVCFLDHNPNPALWQPGACAITHGGPTKVLLWGDSYAAHYVAGIEANANRIPFTVIEYTAAGCPPVLAYTSYSRPGCARFNANALNVIKTQGVRTVILSARWADLQRRGLDELSATVKTLSGLGVRAIVIGQTPMFETDVPMIAARNGPQSGEARWSISFRPSLNAKLASIAGRENFVDPLPALCAGDQCAYAENGTLLYLDDGHFTRLGSQVAVERYFPLLRTGRPGERAAFSQVATPPVAHGT
jgi:hypothetical protein